MTFWQWWRAYWRDHGTKLICSAIGILESAREIPGIIPEHLDKYAALAIVVLAGGGIRRGFSNNQPKPTETPQ